MVQDSKPAGKPAQPLAKADKQKRLSAALKANLQRRKAASTARKEP